MTIHEAIAAVRDDGRQRDARCPAHEDSRASLSIGLGDAGRVLLRCHAGCSYNAIIEAADIDSADLAPARTADPRVTDYAIRDTTGAVVAIHRRVDLPDGKRMSWRQPDGTPGLVGRKVATLPLYGSERLASWPADVPIVLVEGERAADALLTRGVAAVATVTGASGTPSDDVLRVLIGRRVVLWPDADTPGRAHMDRIAGRLAALGITDVRIVAWPEAPEGGDAADYTGDAAELIARAQPRTEHRSAALPIRTPAEIASLTLERPMAYARYVFANSVTQFTGYAKKGKTSFLLYIIGCIVHGVECLSEPTVGAGVVYLTEERLTSIRAALDRAGLLAAPRLNLVSRWDLPAAMAWPEIVEAAVATCEATGSKVLVIDTFPAWAGLRGDAENNAGDVMAALEPVQRAAVDDRAIVIVQHDRKGGGAVGESGRGSSAFAGAVDTILSLRRPEGNTSPNQRLLEAVSRFDDVPEAVVIERASDSFSDIPTGSKFEKNLYRAIGEPGAVELRRTEAAILDALKNGPATMDELKKALPDHKPTTLKRAADALVAAGSVLKDGAGRRGNPFTYSSRPEVSSQTSNPRVRDEKKPVRAHPTEDHDDADGFRL